MEPTRATPRIGRMPCGQQVRRRAGEARRPGALLCALFLPVVLFLCSCDLADSCKECGSGAHWEYICAGWIAPSCGTYCITGSSSHPTIRSECCCEHESSSILAPFPRDIEESAVTRDPGAGGDAPQWRTVGCRY